MAPAIQESMNCQEDDIEALASMYGSDFHVKDRSSRSFSIQINESLKLTTLEFTLPISYPSSARPIFNIKASWLTDQKRLELCQYLEDIYLEKIGNALICSWVERIRQFSIDQDSSLESRSNSSLHEVQVPSGSYSLTKCVYAVSCPKITSGDIISDRKSHFQPHLASVQSLEEVKAVLNKLYENKKIANAFHNMYAYRFIPINSSVVCEDCKDDGEAQAGRRMLALLQVLDVKDVIVVVTRWYGGIQLGPARFKHINKATWQVLDQCGYIKCKVDKNKKKRK